MLCRRYRKDFSVFSVDRIVLAHNLNLSHYGNMRITTVDCSQETDFYSPLIVVLLLLCQNSDYSVETSVVSHRNSFAIGYLPKGTITGERMGYFQSPSQPFSGRKRLSDL